MSIAKSLLLGLLLILGGASAEAKTRPYRTQHSIFLGPVSIQIRSGRSHLPTFTRRGQVYVIGSRGMAYSIWIQNRTSKRLEVVVSVDGMDVISSQREREYRDRGYILNPYRYVHVTGFRTSRTRVSTFRFSSRRNAYAARSGRHWFRIGQIRVRVFYERGSHTWIRPRPLLMRGKNRKSIRRYGGRQLPKAPSKSGSIRRDSMATKRLLRRRRISIPRRSQLGTARGRSRYAPAYSTTFIRASAVARHQVYIRYNNCFGLRRSGICVLRCGCVPRGPLVQ